MLYRFDLNRRIDKHKITKDCMPVFVHDTDHGPLFRCRHGGDMFPCDVYGYATRHEAVREEIASTKTRIWSDQEFLKNLEKKLWDKKNLKSDYSP